MFKMIKVKVSPFAKKLTSTHPPLHQKAVPINLLAEGTDSGFFLDDVV
jgi:hypothetical protein